MSNSYRKIKYESEGPYGSSDEKWLYIHMNNSSDIVSVYDDDGDMLFSFIETGFDMGMALQVAFSNWQDERLLPVPIEEFKKLINNE
jgi:hypothetical protein